MNYVDLHVHSLVSDGSMRPEEIAVHAAERGLSAFALTDHDNIAGDAAAWQAAADLGLVVVHDRVELVVVLGNLVERVFQQVALQGAQLRQLDLVVGFFSHLALAQVVLELEFHQEFQRIGQVACQGGIQVLLVDQHLDALGGAQAAGSVFQRQGADAMHDGEDRKSVV